MAVERVFPKLRFSKLTNLVQPDDGKGLLFATEQAGRILVFPKRPRDNPGRGLH